MVRLTVGLGGYFKIGLSEWAPVGTEIKDEELPASIGNVAELADYIAGGNWMWAVARGVENNKPFKICSYATRSNGKWLFDMHLAGELHAPCFGLERPHLFIPIWLTFSEIYIACKKLLGLSERPDTGEDV
jgi:hypothetical protein